MAVLLKCAFKRLVAHSAFLSIFLLALVYLTLSMIRGTFSVASAGTSTAVKSLGHSNISTFDSFGIKHIYMYAALFFTQILFKVAQTL